MSFDIEPDGDPHGECALEIRRLELENEALLEERARLKFTTEELRAKIAELINERDRATLGKA